MKIDLWICALLVVGVSSPSTAQPAPSQFPPARETSAWHDLQWGDMRGFDFGRAVSKQLLDPMAPEFHFPRPYRETDFENEEELDIRKATPIKKTEHAPTWNDDLFGLATNPLTYSFEGTPGPQHVPDPNIGVGPGYVIECTNWTIRVTDKLGNLVWERDVDTWLNDPGGSYPDGKVIYDPWRNRYCICYLCKDDTINKAQLVMIGSTTSDPRGTWVAYRFNMNVMLNGFESWLDYQDLGFCSKAIVVAGNHYKWTAGFLGDGVYIFNPAELYSTGGASILRFVQFQNPDGSYCRTMRPARMIYQPGGTWDQVLANTYESGGNQVMIWKLTDPLNTNGNLAFTRSTINISSYTQPPLARQQGTSIKLETHNCFLMPVVVSNPVSGVSTQASLWTGFCEATASNTAAARVLMLDPIAGVKHLDTNLTNNSDDYFLPCPAVCLNSITANNAQCTWVYVKTGPTMFPESRYITWDKNSGLGTGTLLIGSDAAYGSDRIGDGDYFGGDMDWDDYINDPHGWQKMWFNGEYANSSGNWRTRVGVVRPEGATNGTLSVTPTTDVGFYYYSGDTVGSVSPAPYDLENPGDVGLIYRFIYGALSNPSVDQAEISGAVGGVNGSLSVTVKPTSGAMNLPYGIYTDNYAFQNAYSGNNANRSAKFHIGEHVAPDSYTIEFGKHQSGGINGVANRNDGNTLVLCRFIVPNQSLPPIRVRFEGTLDGSVGIGTDYGVLVRARMLVAGAFQHTLELYDWTAGAYSAGDTVVTSLGTTYKDMQSGRLQNFDRFLSSNRKLRLRSAIKAVGPVSSANWCTEYDEVRFDALP